MKLTVNLGENSYPIYIENHISEHVTSYIQEVFHGKKVMILSDDNVYPLYGEQITASLETAFECHHLILPHGESTKNFNNLPRIYKALLDASFSRSDLIIALGGGVIGDLAGFDAATFLRGIKYVQIPTSLLAQVDSSVGGKVAVDLPEGKNLAGAFYQPSLVLIDPLVLDTLPERFIHDGMGEVIKYGCIKDAALFEQLENAGSFSALKPMLPDIIYRCVNIKRIIVEEDQFDTGNRMLLNFGHTLAHAIEQYYNYERESHGEAVAIGMYQITNIAEKRGLVTSGTSLRIKKILTAYGLPYKCDLPLSSLTAPITRDKKNLNNHLNIILLRTVGDSYIYPATTAFFTENDRII